MAIKKKRPEPDYHRQRMIPLRPESEEQRASWQAAAERTGQTLAGWIRAQLDRAAGYRKLG